MKSIDLGLEQIHAQIENLTTEIAQLTQLGTSQAKFYIRRDKSKKTGEIKETYYLLHPMNKGKRVKEYVGRDPVEIRKAQERMDRYFARQCRIETLENLQSKLARINQKFAQIQDLINSPY